MQVSPFATLYCKSSFLQLSPFATLSIATLPFCYTHYCNSPPLLLSLLQLSPFVTLSIATFPLCYSLYCHSPPLLLSLLQLSPFVTLSVATLPFCHSLNCNFPILLLSLLQLSPFAFLSTANLPHLPLSIATIPFWNSLFGTSPFSSSLFFATLRFAILPFFPLRTKHTFCFYFITSFACSSLISAGYTWKHSALLADPQAAVSTFCRIYNLSNLDSCIFGMVSSKNSVMVTALTVKFHNCLSFCIFSLSLSTLVTRCWAFVVWLQVKRSLYLFLHETHTKGLCTRSPTRPEENEGRKVPETSQQESEVKRRTQSAEGSQRDQSTEQVSQEMRVGQRGDQSTEIRRQLLGPVDLQMLDETTLEDDSAFLVAFWKFRANTRPR